jgi:hypothetical protein
MLKKSSKGYFDKTPLESIFPYRGPETVGKKKPTIVADIQIATDITNDFRKPILYMELSAISHTIPAAIAAIQPVSNKWYETV